MSLMSWKASSAPNFSFEACAVSSRDVHTAFSSYSGSSLIAGTWALAPQPEPPCVTVAPDDPDADLVRHCHAPSSSAIAAGNRPAAVVRDALRKLAHDEVKRARTASESSVVRGRMSGGQTRSRS